MKLFAIETQNCDGIERKIIRFCGLKIGWSRYRKTLKSLAGAVAKTKDCSRLNSNFVNMLLVMNKKDDDLLYIRTSRSLFIFPKRVLSIDNPFIQQFLLNHAFSWELFEIKPLTECELQREHQGAFNDGNLIYKYIRRTNGCLQRTIISQDETGQLWSELTNFGQYDDTPTELKYVDVPKRKIIDGVMLLDYVAALTQDEKYPFLCRFLDWLFTEYATTDPNKVKGVVWDCHPANFLINDEGFHFIDFDLVSQQDILKTHCIYRMCVSLDFSKKQYRQLAAYFGLSDNWQEDEKENKEKGKQLYAINMLNAELVKHYFSFQSYMA